MKVLRLADSGLPATGKMYHACFELQEHIKGLDPQRKVLEDADICSLVDSCVARWNMLHTDLQAAGYVLDPEFRLHTQHANAEVSNLAQ